MAKPVAEAAKNPEYARYVERTDALIRDTLDRLECQPVFFVGSGFSKRYFGAPGWIELLGRVAATAGFEQTEFQYLVQKHDGNEIAIGDALQEIVFEWAWKKGKNYFPKSLFSEATDGSAYIKFACLRNTEGAPTNKEATRKIGGKFRDRTT
jgi:hypothetical protein